MNKVILIGWLGRDIKTGISKDGNPYASLRLATDRYHRDPNGDNKSKTDWHQVWIFDKKIVEKYKDNLVAGSHIMIEGHINYRDYTDNKGRFNHVSEVQATHLVDLDR